MNGNEIKESILKQIEGLIVGQNDLVEEVLASFFAGGSILIEGVPGLAKTLLARVLSASLNLSFRRIQFTPDLMPSDIIGTRVYDFSKGNFNFVPGPIFTDILLADEINRAPAKTQAALLEAMEERQVTYAGERYPLSSEFFVVATQNPIEYEGTYPLPEALLDRFYIKCILNYVKEDCEVDILKRHYNNPESYRVIESSIKPILDKRILLDAKGEAERVRVEESLYNYIVSLVRATRSNPSFLLGGSTRAAVILLRMAESWAFLQGRNFCIPDDIKRMFVPVLRHRALIKPEVEIETEETVDSMLMEVMEGIAVPR